MAEVQNKKEAILKAFNNLRYAYHVTNKKKKKVISNQSLICWIWGQSHAGRDHTHEDLNDKGEDAGMQ